MYRLFILSPAFLLLTIAALLSSFSSSMLMQKDVNIFAQENLIAWCIVPYDSKHRTPQQRIEMLRKLNFSQYAYDWRHEHLSSLPEEIQLAKQNNIRMAAMWMWIDKETDRAGKLSTDNEKLLEIIREAGIQVQLWIGFNSNFYDQAKEKEKIDRGAEMIQYLRQRTKPLGCSIALYNHGD